MKIGKLGERKAIELIRKAYGYEWPNSDCSSIDIGSKFLLITTDSIAESTHMPSGATPEEIGYFFAATNLSDIAAMGGIPKYFMSSFILPKAMDSEYLTDVQKGIKRCLDKYAVKMIGGDLKKGKELVMTGIAIGEVEKDRKMERLNVAEGDVVCITGTLGKNAAGYHMWKNGEKDGARLLLEIEPRINEGRLLSGNGVRAAMDLSDGLYSVISQLKDATGKGFKIEWDSIPADLNAIKASRKFGVSLEDMCLNFGGEYELFFTTTDAIADSLMEKGKRNGIRITKIGRVAGKENVLVKNGKATKISKKGYEHFISD